MANLHRKVVSVDRFDGPTPNGGSYLNVYTHDDDSIRTIEFSRTGGHMAEYEGEPRELAEGEPRIQPLKAPAAGRPWEKPAAGSPPPLSKGDPDPASKPAGPAPIAPAPTKPVVGPSNPSLKSVEDKEGPPRK